MNAYRSLSKRYRRPGPRVLAFTLLIPVMALLVGLYLGWRTTHSDPQSVHSLQLQLSTLQGEIKTARGDLEARRIRHEVDSQALEILRREIAAQKEQTADLEEGLRFYRSLMAPEGVSGSGLSVRAPELVASERPGRFAFRLVVQQEARKHDLVKGQLTVEITGFEGEQEVTYTLAELSGDLEGAEVPLQFRYFQPVAADIVLPPGFEPKEIIVLARISKPRKTEVREIFPWQLKERFTHVGK